MVPCAPPLRTDYNTTVIHTSLHHDNNTDARDFMYQV